MYKFAKILPESEYGSRKSGSSQDCGIQKRKGGWKKWVRLICRQTWGSKTVRLYAMGLWEK